MRSWHSLGRCVCRELLLPALLPVWAGSKRPFAPFPALLKQQPAPVCRRLQPFCSGYCARWDPQPHIRKPVGSLGANAAALSLPDAAQQSRAGGSLLPGSPAPGFLPFFGAILLQAMGRSWH